MPEFIDRQMELPYGHGAYFYLQGTVSARCAGYLGLSITLHAARAVSIGDSCGERRLPELPPAKPSRTSHPTSKIAFSDRLRRMRFRLSGPPAAAFFAQLLENAREGYFADPLYGGNRGMAAWKWIGFPGARADFTDWIDQAGHKYPYGPVAISGARG